MSRAHHPLRLLVCAVSLAWLTTLGAHAQGLGSGPAWDELTAAQRTALAPLRQEWAGIDGSRRAKWLEIAARFPSLPAAEQARVQGRMAEWARLTPAERGRARANFQEAKQVPAEERQARWEAYQALPAEQRQALGNADRRATTGRQAPPGGGDGKRNIVGDSTLTAPPPKPVAPTVVQAGPGATTTLVTRQGLPPAHQQPGLPKVAAPQGFVDRDTLLPKRGAQGAATRTASAGANPPAASAPRARP